MQQGAGVDLPLFQEVIMIDRRQLYQWCIIKAEDLTNSPDLMIPFRLVKDSDEMGELMAKEFADEIQKANLEGRRFRAIVPCGPKCWYKPFADYINKNNISMRNTEIFHMDECLDWQGNLLADNDPYNFKSFMLKHFYGPIRSDLNVLPENRNFLTPMNMYEIKEKIKSAPIDLTLGGWGQDGHVAYNQSRRHPYSHITIDDIRNSTIRIQENNLDTIIALGHRTYGCAYQFVPPMSITLGMSECLSARKVRVFSDTGAWKQTALRVALFSKVDPEYPITLLQEHPDAVITATLDTARHPLSENPDWEFRGINV